MLSLETLHSKQWHPNSCAENPQADRVCSGFGCGGVDESGGRSDEDHTNTSKHQNTAITQ